MIVWSVYSYGHMPCMIIQDAMTWRLFLRCIQRADKPNIHGQRGVEMHRSQQPRHEHMSGRQTRSFGHLVLCSPGSRRYDPTTGLADGDCNGLVAQGTCLQHGVLATLQAAIEILRRSLREEN